MKGAVSVIVTDFAEVRIGPKWQAFIDQYAEDLSKSKRTKAYKAARRKMDQIESAVCMMAEMEWFHGGYLDKTK